MLKDIDKEDTSPSFKSVQIYRAHYGAAKLVYLPGTPTWRSENSVNIWNLLWLSRRPIIRTEQTSIYISTIPNNSWIG